MGKPSKAEAAALDLLGQLTVSLGGADYTLRPSRQAISNIEKATGKSLAQLAIQCSSLSLGVAEIGVCIAELMRATAAFDPEAAADYRGASAERCADLVYESSAVDIAGRLGTIFTGAVSGGYSASGEVKAIGTKTTAEPTQIAD